MLARHSSRACSNAPICCRASTGCEIGGRTDFDSDLGQSFQDLRGSLAEWSASQPILEGLGPLIGRIKVGEGAEADKNDRVGKAVVGQRTNGFGEATRAVGVSGLARCRMLIPSSIEWG